MRHLASLVIVFLSGDASATCDVQCIRSIGTKDDSKYEQCVRDCEDMSIAVAAANGGVPQAPPPPCFGDLVACGLTGIPLEPQDAEAMSKQISGCMFLNVAMKQLSAGCSAEVEEVGQDKIIECVGLATEKCGAPDEAELRSAAAAAKAAAPENSLPDAVMCMAQELPAIESEDAKCGELVTKFIEISVFAREAAANANHQTDGSGWRSGPAAAKQQAEGGGGEGGVQDVAGAEGVAAGVFGGFALAVLVGAVCTIFGLFKGCQWASQNYKYGTVNQQEDQFEMMEQPSGGAFVDNNEFDDFDQQDI